MSATLVIDAVGAKHSGAATVFTATVDAALRHPRVARVMAFGSPKALRNFRLVRSPKLVDVAVPLAELTGLGRVWWHAVGLPRAARRGRVDAVLALSGGGYGPGQCRSTLFIQQSLPFCREALARLDTATRMRMRVIRQVMALSARKSDCTIVQTNTMKSWVCNAFGLASDRVAVVEPDVQIGDREPPARDLEELRRASRQGTAVLYVGNSSPYKNLDVLPTAMEELVRLAPGALLFGTFPPGHPALRSPHVRALPELSKGALREAYELATALVMPSLVETVGLPMLEAAAAGTPVVAADRPYAHDVCGDAAVFFNPRDPSDLAVKLETLLTDGALRERLVAAGKQNVARRAAGRPYDRMIDIAIGDAAGENA